MATTITQPCAACYGKGTVLIAAGQDLHGAPVGEQTDTCASCEGTGIRPTDPPPWAAFRLELLHSTDYKTAGTLLAPMVGYTLRLTSRGQRARDVSLIDHNHVRRHVGGITVREVDEDGKLHGAREWVAYEDILVIGVY